ncbi:EscD/YscD/HrpQ family type III secretion system inner membrane ring protein [Pseudomonas syringae pv. syringae]|uniref:type III secretion system inner membrane ring subunit SctD n=1 Tax=Pseudomonas syringae TaxID=317 RepID=UPI0007EE606E|nr:type III secretion system inner membrane ring subunit SctD [Pseudomonas syringae]OBS41631.1 EscD/YscD/HrpQ family type III secretion system inner membrane ring protein [Pseudomonas syringae pv. syringae]PBP73683.1 EscD/YscD/HrpQ family type III secretion system inner membrane ring protein [Pseudomonas syringae]
MFELRVLNGQHQGAALPLIGEQWSIGSAGQHDLALDDAGVESLHCRLQRVDDNWTLNAEQGAVCDEQGNARPSIDLTLNNAFMLGSVWLCVSSAGDEWRSVPAVIPKQPEAESGPARNDVPLEKVKSRSQFLNRTTGIIAGLLVGVIGSAWSLTRPPAIAMDQSPAHLAAATTEASPDTPKAPARAANPVTDKRIRLSSADDVRHQLSTMLSDRLLTDVSVEETPDGLVLNGDLKEESLLVYQRMLQRFKALYDSPVTVLDNVGSNRNTLPFVVVQIMTGPHAHLVTADGRRVYVGDEVDGLRLTRIDNQRLQFDGNRHVEVNW